MNLRSVDFTEEEYVAAIKACQDARRVSVSTIQRRLRIGYIKACRLVDVAIERGDVVRCCNREHVVWEWSDNSPRPYGAECSVCKRRMTAETRSALRDLWAAGKAEGSVKR